MTKKEISVNKRFRDRYKEGYAPWDIHKPDVNLINTVTNKRIKPCKAIDIGCGTGDNAIWLAKQQFQMSGVDVSEIAIAEAKKRAARAGVECNFITGDFFLDRIAGAPFGFAFDRGFLHTFDHDDERGAIAEKVASLLEDNGLWLSLIGNADSPHRDSGPPLRTAQEIVTAVEPYFMILSLTASHFTSTSPVPPRIWVCLMRKRVES